MEASFLPTLTCLSFASPNSVRNYDGYQVLRITNMSTSDTRYPILNKLYTNEGLFDMFTPPKSNEGTDVLLCKGEAANVKGILSKFNIPFEVKAENFQKNIDKSLSENNKFLMQNTGMNWKAYQRLSTIQNWMDSLAKQYPNLVSVETFGKSYENRDMKVLKIGTGFGSKPAVWIDGGIHAREWIASATASFIADQLIQMAQNDTKSKLISNVDWYIVPNMNPDGYEYTFKTDRMWRKTRSQNRGTTCRGVDPNRNWNYKWGGKGTSNNPCVETYKGPKAASEKEVESAQKYIYSKKSHIKLLLSLHSYSQFLLTPWAYDNVALEDKADLLPVAQKGAKVLESLYGTKYKVGNVNELLSSAAGGTFDWAKGVAGIKFSYTFELRDTGDYGFLLPTDQIIPTGRETFAAVGSMVEDVLDYYKKV